MQRARRVRLHFLLDSRVWLVGNLQSGYRELQLERQHLPGEQRFERREFLTREQQFKYGIEQSFERPVVGFFAIIFLDNFFKQLLRLHETYRLWQRRCPDDVRKSLLPACTRCLSAVVGTLHLLKQRCLFCEE